MKKKKRMNPLDYYEEHKGEPMVRLIAAVALLLLWVLLLNLR